MNRLLIALIVSGTALTIPAKSAEPDRLAARSDEWKSVLAKDTFQFSDSNAGMLYSLSQFGGNSESRMISEPAKREKIRFQFFRDGKKLVESQGHMQSVFSEENDVLYFAHFEYWKPGCIVTAHDLRTGKKLWETELAAVGNPTHSLYSNKVTMGLSNLTGVEKDGESSLWITGSESTGDYVEILDSKTGKVLAHKVYRLGYSK